MLKKANHIKSIGSSITEADIESFIKENPESLQLGEIRILNSQINYRDSILDVLAFDQDINTYYEIEIMLGEIDHKHISHCLDYWSREKRKKQFSNHCAILICESTRGRYSTLLKTLPDFIPLIVYEFNILSVNENLIFECQPIYIHDDFVLKKFTREPEKKNPRTLLASKTSLLFLSKVVLDETILQLTSRKMAEFTGVSVGATSNITKAMKELGFLNETKKISDKSGLKEYINHILNAFPEKREYLNQNLTSSELKAITTPSNV